METEKTVTLTNGKKFTVKQLKYKALMSLVIKAGAAGPRNSIAWSEAFERELMLSATGMTPEEFDDLSLTDGSLINALANKLNVADADFLARYGVKAQTRRSTVSEKPSGSMNDISTPTATLSSQ